MCKEEDKYTYYRTAHSDRYDILKTNARNNRRIMTTAEELLWQYLRRNSLGCIFRRQHAIGDYIVDFVCISHKLIIELDGKYHDKEEQKEKDETRTEYLNSLGYDVIRFKNEELFGDIEGILDRIKDALYPPIILEIPST